MFMKRKTISYTSTIIVLTLLQETGKIACLGEANFVNGTSIPFEVVTGLKTSTSGQILHFPEIEMHFFPIRDIFPNVKPSILNIPLYKFFPVDLDIGQNANLKVRVDGKRRRLEVSMWAFVTPQKLDRERWKSFRKTSLEESEYKKNAKFYCDVGRWVTKIGRFAE